MGGHLNSCQRWPAGFEASSIISLSNLVYRFRSQPTFKSCCNVFIFVAVHILYIVVIPYTFIDSHCIFAYTHPHITNAYVYIYNYIYIALNFSYTYDIDKLSDKHSMYTYGGLLKWGCYPKSSIFLFGFSMINHLGYPQLWVSPQVLCL